MTLQFKKASSASEVRETFASIEDNGDEWFSNLLARDDELTRWIEKGQVSVAATPTTALLLRQRYGCQRLYFANTKLVTLSKDLQTCLPEVTEKIITTVLDRDGERSPIKEALYAAVFSHYALLKRIVKINEPAPPEKVAAEYAQMDDLPRIEEIIRRYFDPLLDNWPDRDEIANAIAENRILVARLSGDRQAVAMCSFQRVGKNVYERYLASMEKYRGKRYGALLLQKLFEIQIDTRRITTWIRNDNSASIHVHQAMGFQFDNATEEFFAFKA